MALYRLDSGRSAWAMTERGRAALSRTATTLQIGASTLAWDGGVLTAHIDEITAPLPARLRGTIRVTPEVETTRAFPLDAVARHTWRPIAPRARAEVVFEAPDMRWRGDAYIDMNHGAEPLEAGFRRWDWARAHTPSGGYIFYDVERRDGSADGLALRVNNDGSYSDIDAPKRHALPRTVWGLSRHARADGAAPVVRRMLEDTPFYARTALDAHVLGARASVMHESLSLDRFRSPVVRAMLPFRMPRIFW